MYYRYLLAGVIPLASVVEVFAEAPNILFILSDDHTSQTWGIYGGILADYAITDNIRRLANEGVTLDNCFCTNSISSPSRASILTGRYSHNNGVYTLDDTLDTSLPTIATVLQQSGCHTALVGKWHLKSQPQGFDYYSIFYDQGEYRDPTFINSTDPWPGDRNFGERVRGFSTDLVTEKAIEWMKAQPAGEPFLMCCHFKAAYQKLIRDYLRCAATVDDNIGKLLDALDDMGIADNTIVIYAADQGYFLGEHGFFDKRMYYEEAARMPFVIRYPREVPAGKRVDDLILNVDFAATLADYAGADAPEGSQGRSFRDNLRGDTPDDWRTSIYYRYWTQHKERPAHIGVRTDRYKLIFLYGNRLDMTGSTDYVSQPSWEFYDLQEDPYEDHNAYNDPQYQNIIKQMKKEMMRLRTETGDTDASRPVMLDILRAQGL